MKYDCVNETCRKQVTATKNDRYRTHTDGTGERCEMSSEPIPEHVLAQPVGKDDDPAVPREGVDYAVCPQCGRKVKLTRLGYFEPHATTLKGKDTCATTGVRAKHARKTETVALPGDEPLPPSAARPAVHAQQEITSSAPTSESAPAASSPPEPPQTTGAAAPDAPAGGTTAYEDPEEIITIPILSPESTPTSEPSGSSLTPTAGSTSSDAPGSEAGSVSADEGPWPLGVTYSEVFLQPLSPFSQPGEIPVKIKLADSMSERGKEIAARLRETFYAYTNRDHSSNRSAQRTLGPSEIGSPCDRQIAMKLLGVKPVNPQEGWAPFVGTAVHAELARMFDWANGGGSGSGRYHTEISVELPSELVPRGTLDLYDGVLYMVDDHKLMGRWSLDKLIQEGPSETYRVQLHTYGLGAERAGFKVKEVALIGWPRQESSLDKLYVHVEKYDRKIAEAALARVERIGSEARGRIGEVPTNAFVSRKPLEVAQTFPAGDDCKWCPFYNRADKRMERGCPGR